MEMSGRGVRGKEGLLQGRGGVIIPVLPSVYSFVHWQILLKEPHVPPPPASRTLPRHLISLGLSFPACEGLGGNRCS